MSIVRTCTVDGCDGRHEARGYCGKHYLRWRKNGDPLVVRPRGRRGGEEHHCWQGAEIGYYAAHDRVHAARGKANQYTCAHCGGQAAHWAYDHEDPSERTVDVYGVRLTYSADPQHYMPLCAPCHWRFDQADDRLAGAYAHIVRRETS